MAYRHVGSVGPDLLQDLCAAAARLDLAPGPGGSRGSDDQATAAIYGPLLRHLFPSFSLVRIFALYPSAQIVGHRDPPISGLRYHIPLQTNPGCWCFHELDWQQLPAGGIYTMDPAIVHGAVNWGTTLRLHLTVDQE